MLGRVPLVRLCSALFYRDHGSLRVACPGEGWTRKRGLGRCVILIFRYQGMRVEISDCSNVQFQAISLLSPLLLRQRGLVGRQWTLLRCHSTARLISISVLYLPALFECRIECLFWVGSWWSGCAVCFFYRDHGSLYVASRGRPGHENGPWDCVWVSIPRDLEKALAVSHLALFILISGSALRALDMERCFGVHILPAIDAVAECRSNAQEARGRRFGKLSLRSSDVSSSADIVSCILLFVVAAMAVESVVANLGDRRCVCSVTTPMFPGLPQSLPTSCSFQSGS